MFSDRHNAGTQLSPKLTAHTADTIILGIARGGLVVAHAIAQANSTPLDVLVVKKIGSPYDPELGIGAVAPDDISAINWPLAHRVAADEHYINHAVERLSAEVGESMRLYRKGRDPLRVKGKTVVLVDDGAATGITVDAAVSWAKKRGARTIVVALPVATHHIVQKLTPEVDEVVTLDVPQSLESVGKEYEQFPQITDEEVIQLLQQ